jgi:hypothetical protein
VAVSNGDRNQHCYSHGISYLHAVTDPVSHRDGIVDAGSEPYAYGDASANGNSDSNDSTVSDTASASGADCDKDCSLRAHD